MGPKLNNTQAPTRGRPTTLDHAVVLKTALLEYWTYDPYSVSIADICKKTGTSKPAIYRAFGSDDGLKAEVLSLYQTLAVEPLLEIFASGKSFDESVDAVIAFLLQDRNVLGIPNGCLFVMLRAQQHRSGPITGQALKDLRQMFLEGISNWIEDMKSKTAFRQDVPTEIAALFVDAQHAGAMRMQKEDVALPQIESFLRCGFDALRA